MGTARKQKAEVVARKSKSSENKENTEVAEEDVPSPSEDTNEAKPTESTDESPVVIEAEAVDVTETDGSDSTDISEPETEIEQETSDALEEPVEEPVEEPPVSEPVAAAQTETAASGGGASALSLVFGGIVAGAIGFFAASLAPEPPVPEFDATELNEGLATNAASVAAIEAEIAELRGATDVGGLEGELSAVTQSVDGLSQTIAGIEAQIADVASRVEAQATDLDARILALETAVPAASDLATGDELAALRERIATMVSDAETQLAAAEAEAARIAGAAEEARLQAEAEAAEAQAAAEAREAELQAMAERQAALISLKSAVEAGAPFGDLLGSLEAVPDVLSAHAETGIPTIQSLQKGFPEAARAALARSDLVAEDASAGERFTAFLNRRTNARSLTPQEGDGPDAVLSRAEGRLGAGDLRAALSELESLPGEGKAALADWLEQANTRLSAIDAINELSATN